MIVFEFIPPNVVPGFAAYRPTLARQPALGGLLCCHFRSGTRTGVTCTPVFIPKSTEVELSMVFVGQQNLTAKDDALGLSI